jgi:hypothetical protein
MDEILERLMAIRWTYADNDAAALLELKFRIAARARTGNPIQTYSDVAGGVMFRLPNVNEGQPFELGEWRSIDRAIIGDFLGRLDVDSYQAGRFFASALVVHGERGLAAGRPNRAFFDLALRVGLLLEDTGPARERFWFQQVAAANAWFAANRDVAW